MEQFFANFKIPFTTQQLNESVALAKQQAGELIGDINVLKKIFGCIDLTSLNTSDSAFSIRGFCERVNRFPAQFPSMPQVAAVCVYPVFAPVLKVSLTAKEVKKAVVAAGFPSSQAFTDIKVMEARKSVDFGVDEIDVVISVGEFLDENYEFILEEIRMIKDAIGDTHLKVILETGLLPDASAIWRASLLAMEGGANFIKTSTGKSPVSATPEAAYVMLNAIDSFFKVTGKKVGFKPAGGIVTPVDAAIYYALVKNILGDEWLPSDWFRIGASRLANNLLTDISSIESGSKLEVAYF